MSEREETKQSPDDDLTTEERLAWLRERGVLVETPEERKRQQVVAAIRAADALDAEANVTFVKIPCDSGQPLESCAFVPSHYKQSSDPLLEHLKTTAQSSLHHNAENIDLELLKAQQPALLSSSGGGSSLAVSDDTLRLVAQQASMETFTLVHPTPSNSYTGMYLYLDEVGLLKRLPPNARAAHYAQRAGFDPPPVFYGDVYLARIQQTSATNRKFFDVEVGRDTSLDAPWLQTATTDNLSRQLEMNRLTGRSDTQPKMDGTEGTAKVEDGYSWTQTEQELEVTVNVPDTVERSKDITVQFRPRALVVQVHKHTMLTLNLFESIDVDSGTWTLEPTNDQKRLAITMEKVEEAYWPRIQD